MIFASIFRLIIYGMNFLANLQKNPLIPKFGMNLVIIIPKFGMNLVIRAKMPRSYHIHLREFLQTDL